MARIRGRRKWGAQAARSRTFQNPANVGELFVHWNGSTPRSFKHINTEAEERELMRSTQAFHMGPQRGWSDFAYTYAIMPSGRIYRGRGLQHVPASQLNHNTNTASVIVFLGPDDRVTSEVREAIRKLWKHVNRRSLRRVQLKGHREATSTDCPGDRLFRTVQQLRS